MPKLLVVDDEPDVRDLIHRKFTKKGYEVLQSADGVAGIEVARKESPDVILMDNEFGKPPTGLEATRELKSSEATRNIPIVIISGAVMLDAREKAYGAGSDQFWQKGTNLNSLVEKVEQLMRLAGKME